MFNENLEPLTSELLDEYESELKRLLILFNDRQPVLNAFDKWFSFWNEFLQFNVRVFFFDKKKKTNSF